MIPSLEEKLAGRRVIASVSGGKDSAAMSLWLTEQGIEHDRVFLDTGWENALTYEYLRGPLAAKIGPIIEIRGDLLMPDLIRKKAMFPSRVRRFCTEELKVKPMQRYITARVDAGVDVINAVGIRRAESKARAAMPEWEWSSGFDCEVWRPLIHWTEREVIDIHQRNGLAPNPLYLKGASRVGCWPCIYARKSEIKLIAAVDPGRIDAIRALEAEVEETAAKRYAKRGETFSSLGYVPPAFFQAPVTTLREEPCGCTHGTCRVCGPWSHLVKRENTGDPRDDCAHCDNDGKCDGSRTRTVRGGATWPIDRVVEWSRTIRGGTVEDRQGELFAGMNDGCMRWGMCETDPDDQGE